MHIAIFLDQHPMSLGGVQTSVRLQRKFLNRLGVEVTAFAPKCKNAKSEPWIKIVPSRYITFDGEYSAVLDYRAALEAADREFQKTKFDLIHLQGDFASAASAYYLARKYSLPLVHTSHTNIDVGVERIIGKRLKRVLLRLAADRFAKLNSITAPTKINDAWEYMSMIYPAADVVLAPSHHFAKHLRDKGVREQSEVMITGVDDDLIDAVERRAPVPNRPVQFLWAGRFLTEKRLLQTIRAFWKADTEARLLIYGNGPLEKAARSLVKTLVLSNRVEFYGRVDRGDMLQAFADADVVLQTSLGFETQGMTVFEAAAFGTPSLCCDANVASELKEGHYWLGGESVESLAEAMEACHQDVLNGNHKRSEGQDLRWLRQSELTARAVELYRSLIQKQSE